MPSPFLTHRSCSVSPSDEDEFAVYGDYLKDAYGGGGNPDIDSAECTSEWEGLKRLFANTFSNHSMQ